MNFGLNNFANSHFSENNDIVSNQGGNNEPGMAKSMESSVGNLDNLEINSTVHEELEIDETDNEIVSATIARNKNRR